MARARPPGQRTRAGRGGSLAEDADVGGEAAVGEGESADQPSPATVNEVSAAEALQATAEPVRFFELEEAPGQGTADADAEPAEADAGERAPLHDEASTLEDTADGADALDFSVYDRELVDIFVEEGKDLLDHCDGLISELRNAPQDREVLAGLQRDLRFTLRLPQTLAVTQAVFVQIGETTFAVPVASVSGIGRLSRERFEAADSSYRYSGEDYPLYDLGSLVGQAPARADGQDQVPLLLVRAGDLRAAVAIDQVLGNRESWSSRSACRSLRYRASTVQPSPAMAAWW